MQYRETTALHKLLSLKKRIRGIAGGSSASKTISIEQILIDQAQRDKVPTITSITSESMPHLRRGAMRDFLNIMQGHNYFKESRWDKTNSIYTFETGSKIEFFSLDMPSKVRGPRRNRLFINEANNIPKETFEQLEIRTEDVIWLDWNPTSEFWFYTDVKDNPNVDFIILTYLDNEGLPQSIIDSIESHKGNKNWWRVYGMGLLGEVEGRIYTNWQIIDSIPHEARLERYGLDFGYSNDPAALVAVYYLDGTYILDELLYRKGMKNNELAAFIKQKTRCLVVADSAEPKSIAELASYGIPITKARKGQDSIRYGIQLVQQQKIKMTKRSLNLIKEYRTYMWQQDSDGKFLNTPEDGGDNCFTGNTLINTIRGNVMIKDINKHDLVLTTSGYKRVIKKWDNGKKLVHKYLLQFDTFQLELEATSSHKIKTGSTWTQISRLKSGMEITLTRNLMGKNIIYTQDRDTSPNIKQQCTPWFGNTLMVRLLVDIIFIIKMAIRGIIASVIFLWLKYQIIYQCMEKKEHRKIENGLLNSKKRELRKHRSGINQKRVENGIANMEKILGKIEKLGNLLVLFVVKNMKQDTLVYQNTVIKTVKLRHLGVGEKSKRKVYDLTIEDAHEYFANNVLSHNCLDSVRYAVRNIIPDPIEEIKTPKQELLEWIDKKEYIRKQGYF